MNPNRADLGYQQAIENLAYTMYQFWHNASDEELLMPLNEALEDPDNAEFVERLTDISETIIQTYNVSVGDFQTDLFTYVDAILTGALH